MRRTITTAGAALLLLGLATAAHAQGSGGFDTSTAMGELQKVGGLLLAMVFLGFLLVGGYVIVQALVDARKQGGWGHFVIGVFMVLIAGFSLWALVSMSGQNPADITRKIQVK
jgi:uncharacterized membrane protein YjgN (DUF898 family)